jgi:hypothetical protein
VSVPTEEECHTATFTAVASLLTPERCGLTKMLISNRIESTVCYLGIEVDDALAIAEQVDVLTTGAKPTGVASS